MWMEIPAISQSNNRVIATEHSLSEEQLLLYPGESHTRNVTKATFKWRFCNIWMSQNGFNYQYLKLKWNVYPKWKILVWRSFFCRTQKNNFFSYNESQCGPILFWNLLTLTEWTNTKQSLKYNLLCYTEESKKNHTGLEWDEGE